MIHTTNKKILQCFLFRHNFSATWRILYCQHILSHISPHPFFHPTDENMRTHIKRVIPGGFHSLHFPHYLFKNRLFVTLNFCGEKGNISSSPELLSNLFGFLWKSWVNTPCDMLIHSLLGFTKNNAFKKKIIISNQFLSGLPYSKFSFQAQMQDIWQNIKICNTERL